MSDSITELIKSNVDTIEFEVIPSDVCISWLAEKIGTANESVSIQAMCMQNTGATVEVFDAMEAQAEKGKNVTCVVDGYSLVFDGDNSIYTPGLRGLRARRSVNDFKTRLAEVSGNRVQVAVTRQFGSVGSGISKFNPYANRNHIKGYAVDDTVALAGPNLQPSVVDTHDFMFVAQSEKIADWWRGFVACEVATGEVPAGVDHEFVLDEETTILVDAGISNESLIYDRVYEMLQDESVSSVMYVNQMFPTGKMHQILNNLQHKLGADSVTVITSHYNQMSQPFKGALWARQVRSQMQFYTPVDKQIHTKSIIITHKDGRKVCIVTSNNLDERGVKYGTAEIAVVTTNFSSIKNVESFCDGIPIKPFK